MTDKKDQKATVDTSVNNIDVVNKYKVAGEITAKVLAAVAKQAVAGAKIIDLTTLGDELLVKELATKYKSKKTSTGIAFPTSVSVNNVVAHFAPLASEPEAEHVLKAGDLAKITLGAQIDGYASVASDSIVVEAAAEVTGRLADVVSAAWYASEAAIRTIKPGNRNTDVTKIVDRVVKQFGCTALEGMLSHSQTQNVVDGKKRIILNPTDSQRQDFETVQFEEGEVYGLDILVSTGDGKVKPRDKATTIYKKADITYSLKLRTSRQTFSEVQTKAGAFPFNIGILEDQKRARMGLTEAVNHNLVIPYEVMYEKDDQIVAQFFTTFGLVPGGTVKFAGAPTPDFAKIKSEHKIEDKEILDLLARSLKPKKKKAAAAATPAEAEVPVSA